MEKGRGHLSAVRPHFAMLFMDGKGLLMDQSYTWAPLELSIYANPFHLIAMI